MHAVTELALQRIELERIYIWVDYCSIPQSLGLCHVLYVLELFVDAFPQTSLPVFPLNQNSLHTFDCASACASAGLAQKRCERHPAQ